MKKLSFNFDHLVVGGDVCALEYAYKNNLPIIIIQRKPPHDILGDKEEAEIWDLLCITLSFSGLIPFSDNIEIVRYDGENILKVITKEEAVVKIQFEKLIVFDDEGLDGLPEPKIECNRFKVLDLFNVRQGVRHSYDSLCDKEGSDFVNKLLFEPAISHVTHDRHYRVAAISYLTKEQLEELDYSETYTRLKTLRMMKEAGIKGKKYGRDPRGRQKYRILKIEIVEREIFAQDKNVYDDTERIEFK